MTLQRMDRLDAIVRGLSSATCPGMAAETSFTLSTVRTIGCGGFTMDDFPAAADAMPLAVAAEMGAAAAAAAAAEPVVPPVLGSAVAPADWEGSWMMI